jgi:integrase
MKLAKPKKPRPDFPLFPHASGQWAKKIRGKLHYFGTWADPQAAHNKYVNERDDLYAGRTPSNGNGLTVRQLVNRFLTSKKRLVDSGEIKASTFQDYYDNCERVLKVFGPNTHVENLRPADFENLRADFAKTHGAVTLCGDITCTRVLFKYCDDTFDIRVKYGQGFRKPTRAVLRRLRQQRGPKLFRAPEIRTLIKNSGVQLRAMIYLGVNCGFGNHDCAMLPVSAIDFPNGWITFPCPKTGIARRCPLWPETIKAINAAFGKRTIPVASLDDRVFVTKYGNTWEPKTVKDNPISKEFAKILKSDDVKLHRKGRGFYTLRNVFQTIGGQTRDKDAVRAIMGHAEAANDMSAVYTEEPIDDKRLLEVTNHVRKWLRKTR